jgi:inner membrane protein
MPSPIGHTLIGFCGFVLVSHRFIPAKELPLHRRLQLLASCIILANLPDIDVIPGIFMGHPGMYHRQATHSVLATVCLGWFTCFLAKRRFIPRSTPIWATALYASHIILDILVNDISPPFGLQLFWPAPEYFIAPVQIFPRFIYFSREAGMWAVFSPTNLLTFLQEMLLLAPLVGLSFLICRNSNRTKHSQI